MVIGAIIVMASDVSETALGAILAFGAGVYLQVACSESMPRAAGLDGIATCEKMLMILMFAIGATCIGLVLLDHEHCEAH